MNQLLWLDGLENFLGSWIVDTVLSILSFIPKIMYFLVTCLLSVIDLFQVVFRKLAGLDPIMIGEEISTGDSVYKIITDALFNNQYPAINLIFWSLIVLGVIMLIVTSLIATIRLEYNPDKEKGNSKSKIIGNFFKALFNFAIIPIASIFGMYFANVMVQGVDTIISTSITESVEGYQYFDVWNDSDLEDDMVDKGRKNSYISYNIFGINIPTNSEPFSGTVFKASAYSCNRFRIHGNGYLDNINNSSTNLGIFDGNRVAKSSDAADIIDTAFAINAKIKGAGDSGVGLDIDGINKEYYRQGMLKFFGTTNGLKSFSKYNVEMVYYFYDLWTFNFIVAFVAVIVIAKLYANFCLALMARIFELVALFVAAPIIIGIMPLDGGGALGKWRTKFIGKYGLIFAMVFGMNILSPVLSVMQTVKFFGSPIIDYIISTIVIVAGLNAVDSVIKTLSGIIFDKGDAYGEVGDMAKNISGSLQGGLDATKKLAGGTVAASMLPVKGALAGANWARHKAGLDAAGHEKRVQKKFDKKEREQALSAVQYNQTEADNKFKAMDKSARGALADDYLATAEGQAWVQSHYGGDAKKAKKAIENEFKPGNPGAGNSSMDAGARDELQKFMHDRDTFASTAEAQGLAEGSVAYRTALEKYHGKSDSDKAKEQVGGTALNSQQLAIQQARQQHAKKVQEKAEKREKRKEGWGKFVKKSGDTIKPITGTLSDMIGKIPGMTLFGNKK